MKIINKFRELAAKLDSQIDAKMNPAIAEQNPTRRRQGIIRSMRKEGENLKKCQQVLAGMALDLEHGTLDPSINHLKSKVAIMDIIHNINRTENYNSGEYGRIEKKKRHSFAEKIIMQYFQPLTPEQIRLEKLTELEHSLLGTKIPGFFPTPRPIIEMMVDGVGGFIDNIPGYKILEPSAGKGDIADYIKEKFPQADLSVCEVNHTLQGILEAKGHNLISHDFLILDDSNKFDLIIQNPPFERGADIHHVQHAYRLLKEGGHLVSIMSEGAFFRNGLKERDFREWMDNHVGNVVKLESGTFQGKEAFRQTGVASRMVTFYKPRNPHNFHELDGQQPEPTIDMEQGCLF